MSRGIILKVLCGVTVLSGVLLSRPVLNSSAEDGQRSAAETISVKIESSCMLSSEVTAEHSKTIANGLSVSEIGETKISAVCNDDSGYAVYAIGFGSDGVMNYDGETKVWDTDLTSDTRGPDGKYNKIHTGTAKEGTTSAWAMKLSLTNLNGTGASEDVPIIVNGFNDYHVVPDVSTAVVTHAGPTAAPNLSDLSKTTTFYTTYQAYIGPTQAPGTYEGRVRYTLSHPNDTENPSKGLLSIDYMQEITPEICAATGEHVQAVLADERDGKSYLVGKMKDGNCWMLENLRFSGVDKEGNVITLNSDNTDNPKSIPELPDSKYNFTSLPGTTPTGSAYTQETSWTNQTQRSEYYIDDSKDMTNNSLTKGQYYGYYYNWYAATAGNAVNVTTSVADPINGSATNISTGNAAGSICPKGWTLPENDGDSLGRYNNSYKNLLFKEGVIDSNNAYTKNAAGTNIGFTILSSSPLSFVRSGLHGTTGATLGSRGSLGNYWSRSAYNASSSRYLYFYSGSISPQNDYNKALGFSLRCVAKYSL